MTVLSPIYKFSTNMSAQVPYANIRKAAVHLRIGEKPTLPKASLL
jgi:hypothetical protein